MNWLLRNHSATAPHNGHTFSPQYVAAQQTGEYNTLRLVPPHVPIIWLDPFGKWATEGGHYSTHISQWSICDQHHDQLVRNLCNPIEFALFARLPHTMAFKIGPVPEGYTPHRLYHDLYPIVRAFGKRPPNQRPFICLDAYYARWREEPELMTTIVAEFQQLGLPLMGEGIPQAGDAATSLSLCSFEEFVNRGGMDDGRFPTLVVIYSLSMTKEDQMSIHLLGHDIAYTADTFPVQEAT